MQQVVPAALRKGLEALLDESAPGFAAAIAQHDAKTVGHAGDGASIGVAEGVAHGFFTDFLGGSAPDIAKLVAQTEMIAVAKAIQTRAGTFFLKVEEAARYFRMNTAALEDTPMNHQFLLSGSGG